MKLVAAILCGICLVPGHSGAAEQASGLPTTWDAWWRHEDREIEIAEATLRWSSSLPKEKRLNALLWCLIEIGRHKMYPWHGEKIDGTFLIVQRTVLGISGHGRYYARLVEESRDTYLSRSESDTAYESYSMSVGRILVDALGFLPGPEAVWTLGGYLHDERDPPPKRLRNWWGTEPQTPVSATFGLARLDLRGFPIPGRVFGCYEPYPNAVSDARAWYEEIKSGKRPFSFKGQSVEYRFKPDGTWVSTPIANPPDDAPAPPAAAPRTVPVPKAPPAARNSAPASVFPSVWPWIAGGVPSVLGVLCYFLKSRKAPLS